MASKNKVYIVQMDRFSKTHSYVVGVFNKKAKAQEIGEQERLYRGGNKYFPQIIETHLDSLIMERD